MNQIAIAGELLAERRKAAARKAVETRRARQASGITNPIALAYATGPTPREMALHAFEQAAKASDCGGMPDWHAAAIALKAALTGGREWTQTKNRVVGQSRPTALPAPPWHDYDVKGTGAFHVVNPTIVVTFADGEIVRAPAVGKRGKPVNIGRGLRVACAFYQARMIWRGGKSILLERGPAVPEITACHCEDTGEHYDAALCNIKTAATREGRPE